MGQLFELPAYRCNPYPYYSAGTTTGLKGCSSILCIHFSGPKDHKNEDCEYGPATHLGYVIGLTTIRPAIHLVILQFIK